MAEDTREYIHGTLNEEVTAIGGHYVLTGEVRIPFQDGEVLYLTGQAILDTSCCGPGGCAYALVHGRVAHWKRAKTKDGHWITDVIPIRNRSTKDRLQKMIQKKENVTQVLFL